MWTARTHETESAIDIANHEDKGSIVVHRQALKGREGALAGNMTQSLSVPTATTIRQFEVADLTLWRETEREAGRTHPIASILAFALVRTICDETPSMRSRFESDESGSWRVDDAQINLGFAVDVSSSRGSSVMVPVVHGADALTYVELSERIAELADACRTGRIQVEHLKGANVILTSTGKFGATSGIPRLPVGPGVIVAAGRISVPPGLERLAKTMPVDPVLTVTSTYDHRVIQGADSGRMLAGLVSRLQDPEFLSLLVLAGGSLPPGEVAGPSSASEIAVDDVALGHLDVHFDHCDKEQRNWWVERLATANGPLIPSQEARESALKLLTEVGVFERFLQKQFLGQKTLSVEGLDSTVVAVAEIARRSAESGAQLVEVGMAHRGRLALMALVLNWPLEELLREFLPDTRAGRDDFFGDVRQHLGGRGTYSLPSGLSIDVVLEQNPSHLEFVSPVALGAARAAQDMLVEAGMDRLTAYSSIVPVLLHGDTSFTGQGVAYETFNLSAVAPYTVGGSIHIIQDNQLGFTAEADQVRSTRWPSDVVRGFGIPVIRVLADAIDDVITASQFAVEYRNTFGTDVVIHVIGYRRHGHNESDEPRYTQPMYYLDVDRRTSADVLYAHARGTEDPEAPARRDALESGYQEHLVAALEEAKARNSLSAVTSLGALSGPVAVRGPVPGLGDSGREWVAEELDRANHVPDGFAVHSKLSRQFERKADVFAKENTVDWAQAEYLALRFLAEHAVPFRFTGEDTERGTFSHRHLVLHDEASGVRFSRLSGWPGAGLVANTPLTETATLAFEYGYARTRNDAVCIWEGQFGDFVNVAQVIIDQFISAGRQKWMRDGRLVLLLPHGWEGAGPEHSSARLERFLQLAARGNIRVLYPTTAANYFAALVESAYQEARPTVIMTPKSLLRLDATASHRSEFEGGINYSAVITNGDSLDSAERLVVCTGKVGVNLVERGLPAGVHLLMLEQLYPFPEAELRRALAGSALLEVVWVQEEPENMGAWRFFSHELLRRKMAPKRLGYVGRQESTSPAEGYRADHVDEQSRLLTAALTAGVADYWLLG
jgi:2-oxoglutarate decarboxylase